MLLTLHNLTYYQDLMAELRSAIAAGTLAQYAAAFTRQAAPETEAVSGGSGVG
jgi:queuine tRNA-ribosyltransferase